MQTNKTSWWFNIKYAHYTPKVEPYDYYNTCGLCLHSLQR